MACSDPRLTYLNSYGYNVVKLPRVGIDPLNALGRDHDSFEDLGPLSAIWKASGAAPHISGPVAAANVSGQKTDNLKLSVGLDILSGILKGMGAASPNMNAAYSRARSVQFTFVNVCEYLVEPLEVGAYISNGDLDVDNPFSTYFLDGSKQAYIVTSVLRSNSIEVTAKTDANTTLALNVPSIQNAVGANVSVTVGGAASSDITFKGTKELTFGFKIFGISYGGGRWHTYGQPAASGNALSLTLPHPTEATLPIILAPGGLISALPRKS